MRQTTWALARKQQTLQERARIIQSIRAFFIASGFLEVETPARIPVNAPEPHIDALPSGDWQLQTSPELAMKRLLAAGYGPIFQLCRVWRGGERGRLHLPEFTLLEWYRPHADYHLLMEDCIALLTDLWPGGTLRWQDRDNNLARPWEALTVKEAFARHADISLTQALREDRFEEVFADQVEPHLGLTRPTFLIEYPSELAALARCKPADPTVAERFELYVCGLELANAFSELNDPREQRQRFARDERQRRNAGKTPRPLPESFLAELDAMPPAAGIAFGIDRLIMLATGHTDIAEVAAFPPELL